MAPASGSTVRSVGEYLLKNASIFTRAGVALNNWIQRHIPWMHKSIGVLWRCVTKQGTLLPGHFHVIRLLRRLKLDLLISTPHINRSYFDLAQWVLPGLRCLTCCTELDGLCLQSQ